MIHSEHLDRLSGMNVGTDGGDVGKVDEVHVDDAIGEPSFALVNTGLFGLKSSFVPLDQAEITGEDLKVAATKDKVKDAPNMDPDGHLSPDEEDEHYRYYGLDAPSGHDTIGDRHQTAGMSGGTDTIGAGAGTETAGTAGTPTGAETGSVGRDTSGPETDDAMTHSEEELEIKRRQKPAGKARLRMHIVTEHVTKTVPVQRREVTIEREPIESANTDDATDGPALRGRTRSSSTRKSRSSRSGRCPRNGCGSTRRPTSSSRPSRTTSARGDRPRRSRGLTPRPGPLRRARGS